MTQTFAELAESLAQLSATDPGYAAAFVERLLDSARARAAGDVHLQPVGEGLEVRFRIDGALETVGVFSPGEASHVVTRLKVMAGLLTYRTETPQEGRLSEAENDGVEMRVSTFPTLHGERAVIRLFSQQQKLTRLDDLGLDGNSREQLSQLLQSPSGAIIVAGPAGSGKTTTVYACLREIRDRAAGSRCIMTLEDPIEAALDGIVQSQVRASAGFDLDVGLRSLVRQDPEVMMVGEIRDPFAAETVISASLTGHLVLTTFHAEDGAGAISRLLEMDIAPYLIRSGVRAVLAQRLLRRLCECSRWTEDAQSRLKLPIERCKEPIGCSQCGGSGYVGRLLLAELFSLQPGSVRDAILARSEQAEIASAARESGLRSLGQLACDAVESGETSAAEVRRVLGFFSAIDGNRPSSS